MSRAIASKRPASAVGAVSAWREPKKKNASVRIAPAGNRFGPILPVHVSAALFASDFAAMSNEPWTAGTGDDFLLEIQQGLQGIGSFLAGSGRRHYSEV